MPKLTEIDGCLIADRSGRVNKRVDLIASKKPKTQKDLYAKILKARRHIDTHLDERLSIDQLAKIAGIAPAHFARIFRSSFELSPYQYLRERRLAMAKNLLASTSLSITEISLRVGFESLSAFITAFKREFRRSPTEFRKK